MQIDIQSFQQVLGRLARRSDDRARTEAEQQQMARAAPPYVRAVAVHESTTRLVVGAAIVSTTLLLGLVAAQQYRIHSLVNEVRAKEFLVVPGAADFVPIRANLIPDRVITEFASYFVSQMISVTDGNIERRYQAMARFLTPSLDAELQQELLRKAAVLRSLHGAEVFDPLGEPVVERRTEDGRAVFVARVRGRVERYALGAPLEATTEVATIVFQTRSALGAEEPWIFEVTDFVRRTEQEELAHERTQKVVQGEHR